MDEFIKKLIERVEEYQENNTKCKPSDDYELGLFNACEYAIEIVNELAEEYNNGFCKWELKQDMFVKNPHTRRMFSCEPSMKNIYCCTCGKKIKVISAEQPDSISEAWKQRTMSRFERVE